MHTITHINIHAYEKIKIDRLRWIKKKERENKEHTSIN